MWEVVGSCGSHFSILSREMPNTGAPAAPAAPAAQEIPIGKCEFPARPCMSALRRDIYIKARDCKKRTIKKCKEKPDAKKSCKISKEAIYKLPKRQLCSYILQNPTYHFEGQVLKKKIEEGPALRKTLGATVLQPFFTPFEVKESTQPKISDAPLLVYMARFSRDNSVVYAQKDGWKALWTNWDEEEDTPLDDWELTFPSKFATFMRSVKRKGIQHIFMYMRQFKKFIHDDTGVEDISRHANFLHLDLVNKRMYRYEPSGYGLYEVFDMEELDKRLAKWASSKGLKYEPPYDSCPRQLFAKLAMQQRLAGKAKREEGDPGGFCKTWASFMLEQKLRHPDVPIVQVHDQMVKQFLDANIDLNEFARHYTARVNQMGMEILKKHGMKADADPDEFLEKHWKKVMEGKTRATRKN